MLCGTKSQEHAVFIAIHPATYKGGGFLAHGVLKYFLNFILVFGRIEVFYCVLSYFKKVVGRTGNPTYEFGEKSIITVCVSALGLEPRTYRLKAGCSTI